MHPHIQTFDLIRRYLELIIICAYVRRYIKYKSAIGSHALNMHVFHVLMQDKNLGVIWFRCILLAGMHVNAVIAPLQSIGITILSTIRDLICKNPV